MGIVADIMVVDSHIEDARKQGKAYFLNEMYVEWVAEWVLFNHLDLFCDENNYVGWRRSKRLELKRLLKEKERLLKVRMLEDL